MATEAPPPAPAPDADGSPQAPPAGVPGDNETPEAGRPAGPAPKATGPSAPAAESPGSTTPEDKRSVQEIANDYLIPVSQAALQAWKDRPEEYLPYAVETAKGLYPTLADKLSAGMTTAVLVDPYVQVAKQVLGPQVQPDFMDPIWEKALDGGTDPKTGNPALMPLSQWRETLRTDPAYGYDRSPASHGSADRLAQTINQGFTGQLNVPMAQANQQQPGPVHQEMGGAGAPNA